ncbi:hypothetical protein [Shewanella sp. 4_MG-2023]|uniref:hypothetical protein n=1 Tax=Shewanella sp. 4_MG-2023 TaxID=3062652 RepID=UPI0026E1364B|nr:hypothetical protein [Shewanella sp. 4_MG-2023]MDO6679637.1 hypothetical protein [Shewanella sp. 4_MG-2023]
MEMLAEDALIEQLINIGNDLRIGREMEGLMEIKNYANERFLELGEVIKQSELQAQVQTSLLALLTNALLRITEAHERRDWCGMADYIQYDLVALLQAINTKMDLLT